MYKVFIDEKEILFVKQEDLSTKHQTFLKDDFTNMLDLEFNLSSLEKNKTYQVLCSNPDLYFAEIFKNYHVIHAAGGIVESDNKLLFIKRFGLWDIPKGKVEAGEDFPSAAIREIEEECGIIGPVVLDDIVETIHTYLYKSKRILKHTHWHYLSYTGNMNTAPQLEEGITEVVWIDKDRLAEIKTNTYLSINWVLNEFQRKF